MATYRVETRQINIGGRRDFEVCLFEGGGDDLRIRRGILQRGIGVALVGDDKHNARSGARRRPARPGRAASSLTPVAAHLGACVDFRHLADAHK